LERTCRAQMAVAEVRQSGVMAAIIILSWLWNNGDNLQRVITTI
jgi:hypothetical protein